VRRTLDIVFDGRTCVQENMKLARHILAPITAPNIGILVARLAGRVKEIRFIIYEVGQFEFRNL